MPDDYNFKMSDLEYKKYTLKTTIDNVKDKAINKNKQSKGNAEGHGFDCNVSELAESDSDVNAADSEDNISSDNSDTDDVESVSLSGDKPNGFLEDEFNLNVSFSGGYLPNTDLTRVDKGQGNPQFSGLEIKV